VFGLTMLVVELSEINLSIKFYFSLRYLLLYEQSLHTEIDKLTPAKNPVLGMNTIIAPTITHTRKIGPYPVPFIVTLRLR
jgi:hypothetical protein